MRALNTVRKHLSAVKGGRLAAVTGIADTYTMVAFEMFSRHDIEAMFSIHDVSREQLRLRWRRRPIRAITMFRSS